MWPFNNPLVAACRAVIERPDSEWSIGDCIATHVPTNIHFWVGNGSLFFSVWVGRRDGFDSRAKLPYGKWSMYRRLASRRERLLADRIDSSLAHLIQPRPVYSSAANPFLDGLRNQFAPALPKPAVSIREKVAVLETEVSAIKTAIGK